MPIASRLLSTGTLLVNGTFDETTQSNISTRANLILSGGFDEVTGMIVTNGLIAYIDAGKYESYTGTGTSVRDLVNPSTNPATLNGTISYVSAGSASYWNFATGAATNYITSTLAQNYLDCTLVFYPDFTYTSGASLAMGLGAGISADKTMRFGGANGTGPWTLQNPGNTDDWASTATTYYVNNTAYTGAGSLVSGWNIVGGLRTNTTNGAFASNFAYTWGTGFTGRYYQGRLAAIVLYNRQLTAAEQQNNYNYFASRYGLTPATKPPVKRESSNGTLYVNTQIDEFTGAPVVDTSLKLWLDAGQTSSYAGSGATWTDLSGLGNNGTLTASPTFSSTTNGGAFTFNGTNQYVNMSTLASSTFTSVTLNTWVNVSNLATGGSLITKELCYKYRINSDGTVGLLVSSNGTSWSISTTFPAYTYTTGTWVNVVLTISSINILGYINGVQKYSNGSGFALGTNANPFQIGAYSTTGEPLTGSVSAAMVYDRALSADEILTNFNALRGRYGI
jgi:hypothetical protein